MFVSIVIVFVMDHKCQISIQDFIHSQLIVIYSKTNNRDVLWYLLFIFVSFFRSFCFFASMQIINYFFLFYFQIVVLILQNVFSQNCRPSRNDEEACPARDVERVRDVQPGSDPGVQRSFQHDRPGRFYCNLFKFS